MNLLQLALNNLKRRFKKALLALVALALGVATVVAVFSLVREMEKDINRQLAAIGSNVVISAGSSALSFSYGGINIPELNFDIRELTMADTGQLDALPDRSAIVAVSPKLIGIAPVNGVAMAIAGGDLEAAYAVKPWLRLHDEKEEGAEHKADKADKAEIPAGMSRPAEAAPELSDNDVVVGQIAAERLGIEVDEYLEIGGREFLVVGILSPSGGAEDNQVFMNIAPAGELLGKTGMLTVIEIAVDYSLVSEQVMLAQLNEALPYATITSVRQAVMGRNELIGAITRYGYAAASLIFISGIFLVVLYMVTAVRERTREIGIFRAIGFRGSHIFRVILIEGLFLSLLGGFTGYHAGVLAAYQIWPLFFEGTISLAWDPLLLLLVTGITALAGSLAATLPARLASRIDPAEALRFF